MNHTFDYDQHFASLLEAALQREFQETFVRQKFPELIADRILYYLYGGRGMAGICYSY